MTGAIVLSTVLLVVNSVDNVLKLSIILMGLTFLWIFLSQTQNQVSKHTKPLEAFEAIQTSVHDMEMVNSNLWEFHKKPSKFKYILQHPEIMKIIAAIVFVKRYDSASFEQYTYSWEYFLKIKTLIDKGKYDHTYLHVLRDAKRQLLNIMAAMYLSIPIFSNSHPGNLHKILQRAITRTHAITHKCITQVLDMYRKQCGVVMAFTGPHAYEADRTIYTFDMFE
jgi:hypothetical protein